MAKILAQFTDFTHTVARKKLNTFGALGYYRIFKPSQQLKGHQVDIRGKDIINYGDSFEENWRNIFKQYDVVWIMHFLSQQNATAQAFYAEKLKKKLIYDIDDNFLDLDKTNPVYETFKKAKSLKDIDSKIPDRTILSATLSFADALTVSTEPLKERLQAHFKQVYGMEKKIYVIPNMNDVKDWNFKPAKKHGDKIVIGYAGSNSHQQDLLMVFPVIDRLLSKYPNLEFQIMGAIDKTKLDQYFKNFVPKNLERIAMLPATPTFLEYPKYLSEQKWDIAIAPLIDSSFTRCKSHIKWMEYSMYKIPTVASRVYPYFMDIGKRKTIEDGVTGFLCQTTDEWEKRLERLILDEELRCKIGEQAYDYVKKEWQYENSEIEKTFNKMLKEIGRKI